MGFLLQGLAKANTKIWCYEMLAIYSVSPKVKSVLKFQFFWPGHLQDRAFPINLPSLVTQIGLSAASPDLLHNLLGDTGSRQSSAKRQTCEESVEGR